MKTTILCSLLLLCTMVPAMLANVPTNVVALEGKLNYPFISSSGGAAYLQLTVTTADIHARSQRKPMNLAIVLDRSGSMDDERKMDYAKKAFRSLINQLQPNDILSVIVYDDVIDVLQTACPVGKKKKYIAHLVDEIYPRGSTNLGGGLIEGLRQTKKHANGEYINRVILLSDGLANVGMTEPQELNRIAKRHRQQSISISTMGVGLNYNENLMMSLAESGGGNYYFIERPSSLASIVQKEINMIASVLAQNAALHITLGKNVRINNIVGCEFHNDNGAFVIPVGDLYANDLREFTVELSIPSGSGVFTVAKGELRYESRNISRDFPHFFADVRYTKDYVEIEKHRDMNVQAKADIAVSTQKVEEAMKSMDEGDRVAADKKLSEAKELLLSSPAASSSGAGATAIKEQVEKTEQYQKEMEDSSGDIRKAKKSIQYENYRTQKNK